jgi:hypothetical protein
MADSKVTADRKVIVVAALSLAGGIAGTLIGRSLQAALQTTPAWLGPAITVGSAALIIAGILLLPVALRAVRRNRSNAV